MRFFGLVDLLGQMIYSLDPKKSSYEYILEAYQKGELWATAESIPSRPLPHGVIKFESRIHKSIDHAA